jgi:hypothetical protein
MELKRDIEIVGAKPVPVKFTCQADLPLICQSIISAQM